MRKRPSYSVEKGLRGAREARDQLRIPLFGMHYARSEFVHFEQQLSAPFIAVVKEQALITQINKHALQAEMSSYWKMPFVIT